MIAKRRVAIGRRRVNGAGAAFVGAAMLIFAAAAIAAVGWSQPKRVSRPHENANGSVVGTNARGLTAAAWYRVAKHSDALFVRASIRHRGRRFSAPVTLGPAQSTIGANPPSYPSIAVDRRGDVAVAWLNKETAGKLRVVVAYRPAKGHFRTARTVSASQYDSFQPQIGVSGRGDSSVVWQQFVKDHFEVEIATRGRGRNGFGVPMTLSSPQVDAQFPHIGVAANGRIAVAWRAKQLMHESSFIQAVTPSAAGKLSPRQVLSDRSLDVEIPSVAMSPGGKAMVVWEEGNASTIGHVGAAFSAPGRRFGPEQVLAALPDDEAITPRVAIDARGRAVIVWVEKALPGKTGPNFIRWAAANAHGMVGSPHTLYRAGYTVSPRVAVSPQGAAIVIWIRAPSFSSTSTSLLSAVRPAGGKTLRLAGRISPAGAPADDAQLAASSGSATAVWLWHKQGDLYSLYASRRQLR